MDLEIGKDTLLALVAMAWADGAVAPEEAAGIRSAARQLGLDAAAAGEIEAALGRRIGVEEIETLRMTRATRLFTYAVAAWITEIDGRVDPGEAAALQLLGDRLGLSAVARERARAATHALAGGDRGLDLTALRAKLATGLSQVGNE
ncbi:MAG: TerB family tellurite resistance protein [Polyangiaceae bacterium]|nr:TerB family tellurite resistance protein [Polyangiaceae bacterium]